MKIIISDFDNTFYTKDYLENIKVINEFTKKGHKFIIATGRPLVLLKDAIINHEIKVDYYICADGGTIFDANENLIYQSQIDKPTIVKLKKLLESNPIIEDWFVNEPFQLSKDSDAPANGVLGLPYPQHDCRAIMEELDSLDDNIHAYKSNKWINIIGKNTTKANGILKLLEITGLDKKDVITIGDNDNDISMNKIFESYAVLNSSPKLKEISKHSNKSFKTIIEEIGE